MIRTSQVAAEQLLSGDRSAMRLFYATHVPVVAKYIRTKIFQKEDAEEVLQDSLYAFLEALRDFNNECSLQTFLYSIACRKVVDYYRRKKLANVVFSKFPKLYELVSPLLTPEESLDSAELRRNIANTFSVLLPVYKKVLHLKYEEGRTVEEMAKLMKTSLKSVEMSLFRARKAFVREYGR